MLQRFLRRVFRRGAASQRSLEDLGSGLETLTRAGVGGWLLAQERARLEFLSAKAAFTGSPSDPGLETMLVKLIELQATNSIVQSLLNEHTLEKILAGSAEVASSGENACASGF